LSDLKNIQNKKMPTIQQIALMLMLVWTLNLLTNTVPGRIGSAASLAAYYPFFKLGDSLWMEFLLLVLMIVSSTCLVVSLTEITIEKLKNVFTHLTTS
jgi:hypothetical protein